MINFEHTEFKSWMKIKKIAKNQTTSPISDVENKMIPVYITVSFSIPRILSNPETSHFRKQESLEFSVIFRVAAKITSTAWLHEILPSFPGPAICTGLEF